MESVTKQMEELGATNPKYHAAIASLMAPIRAPTLEKPSSWHPFNHLQDK